MIFIPPSADLLRELKQDLVPAFPSVPSSHLTEALAHSCGFKSNAALRAALWSSGVSPSEVLPLIFSDKNFEKRLLSLNHKLPDGWLGLDAFAERAWVSANYRSERKRAGRALLVAGLLSGFAQGIFSLRSCDNRWPGAGNNKSFVFPVWMPNGIPAKARVSDAGMGELSLSVACWPSKDFDDLHVTGFAAGEAFAHGWFEREDGKWIMEDHRGGITINIKRHRTSELSALTPPALGFEDCGIFMM
tara:strand:+ start:4385 stop:5122 length:738 start_codon:yes stop_codon:yes gene_type:complete